MEGKSFSLSLCARSIMKPHCTGYGIRHKGKRCVVWPAIPPGGILCPGLECRPKYAFPYRILFETISTHCRFRFWILLASSSEISGECKSSIADLNLFQVSSLFSVDPRVRQSAPNCRTRGIVLSHKPCSIHSLPQPIPVVSQD